MKKLIFVVCIVSSGCIDITGPHYKCEDRPDKITAAGVDTIFDINHKPAWIIESKVSFHQKPICR